MQCIIRIVASLSVVVGSLVGPGSAQAASIGIGAFTGSQTVQNYDGLGLPFTSATPQVIGADTYTTDDSTLRYFSGGGPSIGTTGDAIGSDTDLGFINILLGTPVLRAGGFVGIDSIWTATVTFFDQADVPLGTVLVGAGAGVSQFAGWQADAGLIQRIRITDTSANGRTVGFDDLTTEASNNTAIPEPAILSLIGTGLVGLSVRARRRR